MPGMHVELEVAPLLRPVGAVRAWEGHRIGGMHRDDVLVQVTPLLGPVGAVRALVGDGVGTVPGVHVALHVPQGGGVIRAVEALQLPLIPHPDRHPVLLLGDVPDRSCNIKSQTINSIVSP
jgi:hypothetical protein